MTDGPVEDVTIEQVRPQDEQQRKLLNTNHKPEPQANQPTIVCG